MCTGMHARRLSYAGAIHSRPRDIRRQNRMGRWCTCSTQPGIRQQRAPMLGPFRSRGARSDGSSLCCSVTSRKPASCGARGDHGGTEGAAVSNRSTEDPLTMTCRHVREAEGHVARQEALIQELDRDGHIELAVEVRELL